MHTAVFYLAVAWAVLLLGAAALLIARQRSLLTRVLALDTMTLLVVALLTLIAHYTRAAYYLDAALVLALLSFGSTLAAARYHSQRRIFE